MRTKCISLVMGFIMISMSVTLAGCPAPKPVSTTFFTQSGECSNPIVGFKTDAKNFAADLEIQADGGGFFPVARATKAQPTGESQTLYPVSVAKSGDKSLVGYWVSRDLGVVWQRFGGPGQWYWVRPSFAPVIHHLDVDWGNPITISILLVAVYEIANALNIHIGGDHQVGVDANGNSADLPGFAVFEITRTGVYDIALYANGDSSPTQTSDPYDLTVPASDCGQTDKLPPVIAFTSGTMETSIECHSSYIDPVATATDNVDGTVQVAVTGDMVDPDSPGAYVTTYTATDEAGNTATLTRTVHVVDTIPPVVTLVGAGSVNVTVGQRYTDPGATAIDSCQGTVVVFIGGDTVNTAILGDYHVTYNAIDPAGNTAKVERVVRVVPVVVTTTTVPNILGRTQAQASLDITSANLVVGTITTAYSNTVPTGKVIISNPVAGTTVSVNTAVSFVVSLGVQPPTTTTVPNVIGLLQADAENSLMGAHLTVGVITESYSSTTAAGRIISANPQVGSTVAINTPVNLVVSKGSAPLPLSLTVTPQQSGSTFDVGTDAQYHVTFTGTAPWHLRVQGFDVSFLEADISATGVITTNSNTRSGATIAFDPDGSGGVIVTKTWLSVSQPGADFLKFIVTDASTSPEVRHVETVVVN